MPYAVFCLKKIRDVRGIRDARDSTLPDNEEPLVRRHEPRRPCGCYRIAGSGVSAVSIAGRADPVPPTPAEVFFFNDTATTEIYTLSLHDALPISSPIRQRTRVIAWPCVRSRPSATRRIPARSEEHTSELQSQSNAVCRLLLEKNTRRARDPRCARLDAARQRGTAGASP